MTLRPSSHQIGDLAVAQVAALLSTEGWIVERIGADYGEDLVVQLCGDDQVVPFRLYFQVKGTKKLQVRGDRVLCKGIKRSTIARWLKAAAPVILVRWDVTRASGVYGFVAELADESAGRAEAGPRTVTLEIPSCDSLDAGRLGLLKLRAMLHYAESECVKAHGQLYLRDIESQIIGVSGSELQEEVEMVAMAAGALVLESLGLLRVSGPGSAPLFKPTLECDELFSGCLAEGAERVPNLTQSSSEAKKALVRQAAILTVLRRAQQLSLEGVFTASLGLSSKLLAGVYSSYLESFDWAKLLSV
jgi:hypothetical protein